ncbi:APC family permease [Dactylosporangium sp. CA-139114]|uniref:APC family permease n=1 Tax=Dactylosporangium sp. CA-139114 TaxID=3239931 RepID=UPI003D9638D5
MTARIGPVQATALYVGALLGPGVLTLPALAAAVAGAGSLLAWAALVAASVPLAATFTALAVRHRQAGGIAGLAEMAFGPRAFAVIGWCFYCAAPLAACAAALIGGQYAATALGAGHGAALAVAGGILAVVFTANLFGLHTSGRLQLCLVGALLVLLTAAVVSAAPHVNQANLHSLVPASPVPVGRAMAVLFIAFSGWEACGHLTDAVVRPERTLPKVAAAAVAIVGVLYLALATVTIGVLGPDAASTPAPFITLLRRGIGEAAGPAAAAVALLLTCGAGITFVAGAVRLGDALAIRGALPALLSKPGAPAGRPRRNLLAQAGFTVLAAGTCVSTNVGVGPLLRVLSVLLAAVTLAGTTAGIVLLPSWRRTAPAVISTAVTAVVLGAAGPLLAAPAVLGAGGATFVALRRARRPREAPPSPARPAAAERWQRRPAHRSRRRRPLPPRRSATTSASASAAARPARCR